MGETDPNVSATALKALAVLDVLGEHGRPLTVTEVAGEVRADRATAYRMLTTLVEAGYVRRDERDRRYRLGFKLLSLARHLVGEDERARQILAALRRISEETGETVHYSVLDGDAAVLIFRAKGTQRVAVDFQIGDRSPLHCTSIGKVLLAWGGAEAVESVIAAGLPGLGPRTITDPAAFRREIASVRAQGYAYDDLEFAPDMRCLAVPVFEAGGRVPGGIAISGPSSRFVRQKLDELRAVAAPHAAELSRLLGGVR
jgi:DNA-binding IclR family transcriptional regulator